MDDRKNIIERITGATDEAVQRAHQERKNLIDRITSTTDETRQRVQQEMSQSTVVTATKERASAMRLRAQQAAMSQLQLATSEDIARLQASLDRVEAALNDLADRIPKSKPRTRARAPKPPTPAD